MPSAIPRNSERVPSVTISRGTRRLATSSAFSAPPAHPTARASAMAPTIEKFHSRYAAPITTADRPSIDPIERSMPPVTMTGVMATDNRPSSMPSRTTSAALAMLRKCCAISENTATSTASMATSDLGMGLSPDRRRRHRSPRCRPTTTGIHRDSRQNDHALNRALPVGAGAEERQCWTNRSKQHDAEQRPPDGAAPTSRRDAADDDGGNHFHLEADAAVAGHLIEPNGVQSGRHARQRARECEHAKLHHGDIDA